MKILRKLLIFSFLFFIFINLCYTNINATSNKTLKFNSDGNFKIVVFADCQDDSIPYFEMIQLMEYALDTEKPDLVVFTGDNIVTSNEADFKTGAQALLEPLIKRNTPYAYTFGNHDDEFGVSKEYMHEIYMSLGNCLTFDANPSLNGFGNCNIPIYSSNGNDIAFNLWIIDSLAYGNGGYNHVQKDQLEWYKQTSLELEQQAGHKVNSLMFQHIPLPEIYNLLRENKNGSHSYHQKKYDLALNSNAQGYIGEFPCPPAINGGQFDALTERGDVIGVVTGHDHANAFRGTYQNIDFIQMPGISYSSYGDDNCRGYGVIEINEKDTSTCSSYTVTYIDFRNKTLGKDEWNDTGYFGCSKNQYISDINIFYDSTEKAAKQKVINAGYTLIDYNLNKDTNGKWIYMGYKTTSDFNKAIRDIRYYIGDNSAQDTISISINDYLCEYTKRSNVDLNMYCGGEYIYAYVSYDTKAGPPVTGISFGSSSEVTQNICGTTASSKILADLNKGTNRESIFCYLNTLQSLDIVQLLYKINEGKNIIENNKFENNEDSNLKNIISKASSTAQELIEKHVIKESQQYIDYLYETIDSEILKLKLQSELGKITIITPKTNNLKYNESIKLSIESINLSEGTKIKWKIIDGSGVTLKESSSGETCIVKSKSSGNVVIEVYAVDENGNDIINEFGERIYDQINISSKVNAYLIIFYYLKRLLVLLIIIFSIILVLKSIKYKKSL